MNKTKQISLLTEYIDQCGLVSSLESFLCSKGLLLEDLQMKESNTIKEALNDSEENKRLTAVLRAKLKADIKRRESTAYAIRAGIDANPYPIGRRAVHAFANDYEITSNAHKWLMFIFFEQQDETEQDENPQNPTT